MAIPIFPGSWPRRVSRSTRIKRRARELSVLAHGQYIAMITLEIELGTLDPEMIEFWEPKKEATECPKS